MEEIKTKLIIIGAGPGGLGAALYAKRAGLDFEIVDSKAAGGQIMNTGYVENYPGFKEKLSGYGLAQNLVEHVKSFDISIREYFDIERIEISAGKDKKEAKYFKCYGSGILFKADSVIIATGASPQRLNVEGEKELIGKGISFCATCDGALYRDKVVVVVGGGDAAVEEALFLSNLAKKVYLIHRRDQLRACNLLQCRINDYGKVEFLWDTVVEKFVGSEKLEEVILKNKKESRQFTLKADGVFEYVGWAPNSKLIQGLVNTNEKGFILTDVFMRTSLPGVFAIGDVRNTPLRQVITAVSDGAVAAMYVDKFLHGLDF